MCQLLSILMVYLNINKFIIVPDVAGTELTNTQG